MLKYITFLLCVNLVVCTAEKTNQSNAVFHSKAYSSGRAVKCTIVPGDHFLNKVKRRMITLNIFPQIAVWLGDSSGTYLQTIYVTKRFGKQEWRSIKQHPDSTYRTMCMPYWFNHYKAAGNTVPTSGKPLPDAICGATPTGNFTVEFFIPDTISTATIYVEWNNSFDQNKSFTTFNGQPSLIASTKIDFTSNSPAVDTLTIIGHGGNKGDDAALNSDIKEITTASSIFDRITVSY